MIEIKGYWTDEYYMGFVDGEYKRFVSDTEYVEYLREREKDQD